jgi:hypothetical protein
MAVKALQHSLLKIEGQLVLREERPEAQRQLFVRIWHEQDAHLRADDEERLDHWDADARRVGIAAHGHGVDIGAGDGAPARRHRGENPPPSSHIHLPAGQAPAARSNMLLKS